MTSQRFMYYIAWCITDGAMMACGLGYKGLDKEGRPDFTRIMSIYILEIELGTSPATMMM